MFDDFKILLGAVFGNTKDLKAAWHRPRTNLPSLGYLEPKYVILSAGYGFAVLILLMYPAWELYDGYVTGRGLEVDVWGYLFSGSWFLLSAAGAAFMLRRLAFALNARRQARKTVVIAEYKISLSPVEVGILIDAHSSQDESAAILYRLIEEGAVSMETMDGHGFLADSGLRKGLSEDEKVFADAFFHHRHTVHKLDCPASAKVAGKAMRDHAYARLFRDGHLPLMNNRQKLWYFVMTGVSGVGIILGLVILSGLFFGPEPDPNPPLYPIAEWQLGFFAALILIVLVLPLQAYFSRIYSKTGLEDYRKAAGLYMYMQTVFKHRWKDGKLAKSELQYYLPYAQAFGIDDTPRQALKDFLP